MKENYMNTKTYPCGCAAGPAEEVPNYCPEHGHRQEIHDIVGAGGLSIGASFVPAEVIHMTPEDQAVFAEAIINPPETTEALKRAFQRREALVKDLVAAGMADLAAGRVVSQEYAKKLYEKRVNPTLRDLGARLGELLDDDQWHIIEPLLNDVDYTLDALKLRISDLEAQVGSAIGSERERILARLNQMGCENTLPIIFDEGEFFFDSERLHAALLPWKHGTSRRFRSL